MSGFEGRIDVIGVSVGADCPITVSIKIKPPFRNAVSYHQQVNHELEKATSQGGQGRGGHMHEVLK